MDEARCPTHPWGRIRPYRTSGPHGRGVYSQCVPATGEAPHLLEIQDRRLGRMHVGGPERLRGDVHIVEGVPSVLTRSELEVLCAAANGLTAIQTAHSLVKGEATVKTQRRQIMLKLGARNIAHAVCIATEDGIVRCADPVDASDAPQRGELLRVAS
jgi:DNA-binding CsgD family transcriptional regulator